MNRAFNCRLCSESQHRMLECTPCKRTACVPQAVSLVTNRPFWKSRRISITFLYKHIFALLVRLGMCVTIQGCTCCCRLRLMLLLNDRILSETYNRRYPIESLYTKKPLALFSYCRIYIKLVQNIYLFESRQASLIFFKFVFLDVCKSKEGPRKTVHLQNKAKG